MYKFFPEFNIDDELAKLATICLRKRDYVQLAGNIIKEYYAVVIRITLVDNAVEIIGLRELRAVLGFKPLRPWEHYREPSKEEIAAAQTIEQYYDLKEPRGEARSLDSRYFFEHNLPPAIAFLDERFPVVRASFRRRFEEIRRHEVVKDRKLVDRMLEEWIDALNRVNPALDKMFNYSSSLECTLINRNRKD